MVKRKSESQKRPKSEEQGAKRFRKSTKRAPKSQRADDADETERQGAVHGLAEKGRLARAGQGLVEEKGRRMHARGGAAKADGAAQKGQSKRFREQHEQQRSFADMVAGRLEDESLKQLYTQLPPWRGPERLRLMDWLRAQMPMWHLLLREDFNLVFFGAGSKRDLLNEFGRSVAQAGGAVIAVNAYIASVSAHKVLEAVGSVMSVKAGRGGGSRELLANLRDLAVQQPQRRCYVIVHNIDGPGLREEVEQALLSELASCSNVHLLASIDRVNAPLLWSRAVEARFNWSWIDATTYAPYVAETLDRPSMLTGSFQRAQRQGASVVLRSLGHNARDVFAVMVEHQLEEPEGIEYKLLLRKCRERFLLSGEVTLKTYLGEFADHQLVETRRGPEGADVLWLTMEGAALQAVLQELEAQRADDG